MANEPQRSLHDLLRRPVIGPQKHPLAARIILFKAQHDLRLRAAEPVNRLIVVPNDKQVVFRKGQKLYDLILQTVDILELIHQKILIFSLPGGQNILPFTKQLPAHGQHIVKIQLSLLPQHSFISGINFLKQFLRTILGIIAVQIQTFPLHIADLI